MKVYKEIVIDISTGETLSEDSFEWEGQVIECKGGGGGSSGTVDFPDYMKTVHGEWLDNGGVGVISAGNDITALIDGAIANSPYNGEIAYDPDDDIAAFIAEFAEFDAVVDALNPLTNWDTYIDAVKVKIDNDILDETAITNATQAHADVLEDRLNSDTLPRFKAGMRDMNAVISSSFTTGQAIIEGFNLRSVADFDAKLRATEYGQRNQYILQGTKDVIQLLQLHISSNESIVKAALDLYRTKAVMKKEELDEQLDIDMKDYQWPLELYQKGGNVLASISGASTTKPDTPSKMQTVLGGAMSGFSAGMMIPGMQIPGAILGGLGGLLF